jgi:hypothetical protein
MIIKLTNIKIGVVPMRLLSPKLVAIFLGDHSVKRLQTTQIKIKTQGFLFEDHDLFED